MGYVIGFCIMIAWSVYSLINKFRKGNKSKPVEIKQKPQKRQENDKLILVVSISNKKIKETLTKLCSLYNQKSYAVLPRLHEIDKGKFAVIFPYDTDFQTFCYAINFIKYPVDVDCNPEVTGWMTTPLKDDWITPQSSNKKAMIFLADDDEEGDNVFLTTQDGVGYKMGFGKGYEKQLLKVPEKRYVPSPTGLSNLANIKFEDFE